MAESSRNEQSVIRGRGRGFILKKLYMEKEKSIDNCSVPMSTYIPKEISETDDSIYETGIDSGINFNKLNNTIVNVSCVEVPEKVENFDSISIKLKQNIAKCKFIQPTPIQKYTIPIILSGKDILGAAQTGSGKTVAYVLPIIHMLIEKPRTLITNTDHCEPQVIIISPTRELAVQIYTVVLKLIRGTGISSLVCYGGTLVSYQKNKLLQGCHVLVATPGRLIDFVQHDLITFESVRFLVIDEVDKILDFESKEEIDKLIDHVSMPSPKHRQTIMLSATLPDIIQDLAGYYLNTDYVFLTVGTINSASNDITQEFYKVFKGSKHLLLHKILSEDSKGTMVFVNKKWIADFLATYLSEYGIPTTSIHSNRAQQYRELALNDFTSGKMDVIITTSVASRGLDIKCIQKVINYDMPEDIEEYIQRIGRTGRLGNTGTAISFFDLEYDYNLINPIIKLLLRANQKVPDWLFNLGKNVMAKTNEDITQELNTDIRTKLNVETYNDEDW